jgi:virulence-associated protein VagC
VVTAGGRRTSTITPILSSLDSFCLDTRRIITPIRSSLDSFCLDTRHIITPIRSSLDSFCLDTRHIITPIRSSLDSFCLDTRRTRRRGGGCVAAILLRPASWGRLRCLRGAVRAAAVAPSQQLRALRLPPPTAFSGEKANRDTTQI